MATYIVLADFTEQGIRNVKDTVKRAEAFKEAAGKFGVTVKELYWTLGRHDLAVTVEGPDDPSVTALGLALGALGNVRTQTLRAFEAGEMKQIIDKMA
ncbi:MAG: GYD domain-containing protein [Rhodomicrobium sp.]